MRVALISTTIYDPTALRLLRTYGPDVAFFITGDEKTPTVQIDHLGGWDINNPPLARYYSPQAQRELNYQCSNLIGWNCIQRRNIAILEALRWGADIIVSWDTDNMPMDASYFDHFCKVLAGEFAGLQVGTSGCWLDYGRWLVPPATQRGMPQPSAYAFPNECISFVTAAPVGVAQGICLGDPDTSAVDRISRLPEVHQVSELLRVGVVVHPEAHTVFNTQNTAFIRELAPCFLMVPQFGRYDDIFASLICRHIMRETGHYLHLGQPFCWQTRNQHDLLTDLKNELWGMEHVIDFVQWLDSLDLGHAPHSLHYVRLIYGRISELEWLPSDVSELGLAWCSDCESVL